MTPTHGKWIWKTIIEEVRKLAHLEDRIHQLRGRSRRPLGAGQVAAQILDELDIPPGEFAGLISIPQKTAGQLLLGESTLTPDLARRLGHFFGDGPAIWINLQSVRDMWDALHLNEAEYSFIETVERKAA